MNKLQEMIATLEADDDRGEMNDRLLEMLRKKQLELGDDVSDEKAEDATAEIVAKLLMETLGDGVPDLEAADEDVWNETMQEAIDVVHRVFRRKNWKYRDYTHQKGVKAFELGLREDGKLLHVKVYLEAITKVCRIDAVYPFLAEREFVYPLCEKLAKENYPRRYGALQYDAKDGELSYRYSFPIRHGLHEDDFVNVLMAVMASAHASFDVVKQYAVGRFRRADREEIICKAQKLIIELDQ